MERTEITRSAIQIMTDAERLDQARRLHEAQCPDREARYERAGILRRILSPEGT